MRSDLNIYHARMIFRAATYRLAETPIEKVRVFDIELLLEGARLSKIESLEMPISGWNTRDNASPPKLLSPCEKRSAGRVGGIREVGNELYLRGIEFDVDQRPIDVLRALKAWRKARRAERVAAGLPVKPELLDDDEADLLLDVLRNACDNLGLEPD